MSTATAPASCPRCGGPGKVLEGFKRPQDPTRRGPHRRRVCVPCGRSLGVVWTEFQVDGPAGSEVRRVNGEPRP